MFSLNADFTQADNQAPAEANGLVTDGQMWIGSTATNVGGTHINVGSITSPDSSVTIGYSSPNITLQTSSALTATLTLTSAQIKNLNATPITIVPAQGAGTAIIVYSVVAKFVYGGSNVFVAGAGQSISLAYNNVPFNTAISNTSIVSSASSYQFNSGFSAGNVFTTAQIENAALQAYNGVATEISGNAANDNTITFVVKYYVVTI